VASDDRTFLQRIADHEAAENPPPPRPTTNGVGHVDMAEEPARQQAYARAALRGERDLVAFTAVGTRNDTLNRAAFNMDRFVTEGILDREEVDDELTAAGRAAGLPDAEIKATLASAARGAAAKPRDTPAVPPPRGWDFVDSSGDDTADDTEEPSIHPIWGHHPPAQAGAYLFDYEDTQTALWGDGEHILWAEGEALMIAGGMGLGKTTLAGQLLRAQLGLDTHVLNYPVATSDGPILYLAMDRPRQIRRSMLRQFDPTERDRLDNLLIRPGPPIADIAVRPTLIAEMAQEAGATTIYIDSLKDAAIGLSSDEVGAAYNRARQYALANGCQLCELHHLIKRNPLGGSPNSVADVYGSNWLTAGAGSVIMLTGDPGDPIVEFRHAKQPHSEVGPFRLLHDQVSGHFSIDHEVDLVVLAGATGATGLTPTAAASAIFEKDKPSRAQVEKARRRLDKLAASGQLVRVEGMRGGVSGSGSANYFTAH
jgi:hypothetical protein